MQKVILIGGGGHCKSVIDVIEYSNLFEIVGIIDTPEKVGEEVLGYRVIGTDEDLVQLMKVTNNFLITVGQIGLPEIRVKLFNKVKALGGNLVKVVSKDAYLSPYAEVGEGTVILHKAVVNANAKIGYNSIINTKALVEHDAFIGNHTHIATNAIINGGVKVGNYCMIGSGAVIIQNVTIADFTIIGANSVVVDDILESGVYVGNPAKKIKNIQWETIMTSL